MPHLGISMLRLAISTQELPVSIASLSLATSLATVISLILATSAIWSLRIRLPLWTLQCR